eukprot:CAMPEP_0198155314 /NCGR_PEP_ID=MMETSP1443-20131203/69068_1 /TAXON_ID=186043 /ORGANISM="Entomoneis sp., Strain CCMP2396" /LENGTH=138 /DNA_ID=CAMNT_0043822061 /DNA_START=25 /DNA_END=441 /DNA_ORIENTATION=+
MTFSSKFAAILILVSLTSFGSAFVVHPRQSSTVTSTTKQNLFGGLADAFKSDAALGTPQNAGLKNGPNFNEQVTVNGKKVQGAVAGQKLTAVAMKARVKIPVNCQKGDCGTCMVKLNGRQVKGCQTPLPSGKAAIQTL